MRDGTGVGYINVFFCAGRTVTSVFHTLAVFYQNIQRTQPMTVFFFSKNEIPDYHGVCSLLVFFHILKIAPMHVYERKQRCFRKHRKRPYFALWLLSSSKTAIDAFDGVSSWFFLVDLPQPKKKLPIPMGERLLLSKHSKRLRYFSWLRPFVQNQHVALS